MPLDPLADLRARIEKLEALLRSRYLERSSIDNGRMRFIGGTLRVDSGGRVEIVGTLEIEGTTTIGGAFTLTGENWSITGRGEISGDVTITGKVTQVGDMDVDGVLTVNGNGWSITGDGEISGDVQLTGKLNVGGMRIDPDDAGGSIVFPSGAKVTANDGSAGVKIESGTGWAAYVAQFGIRFSGAAGDSSMTIAPNVVAVTSDNIQLASDSLKLNAGTADIEDVTHWLGLSASGAAKWVSKSQGGPTGSGEFRWPFPLAFVSREYGPGYAEYDDGVHKGIDFSGGPAVGGAPIPASSGGTVIDKAFDSERGNYVILSHGNRGGFELTTRYYHLSGSSPLSVGDTVAKGQTLGLVGTTGLSNGNHLHFETRRNGEHMNPRSFMEIYGE